MVTRPTQYADAGAMALDREWATYEREKASLMKRAGEFVLIHGDRVVDFFPNVQDAHREGYRLFPADSFLVHQVVDVEPVHTVFRARF